MQVGIGVQLREQGQQIDLGSLLRENVRLGSDAEFRAGFFFAPNVNLGSGIFPAAHEGQSGLHAARLERDDALREFVLDLARDEPTINEVRRRHYLTT